MGIRKRHKKAAASEAAAGDKPVAADAISLSHLASMPRGTCGSADATCAGPSAKREAFRGVADGKAAM